MKITILTLFPGMIKGFIEESIIKRAQEKKLVEIELINIRDFTLDDYGTVDDRPYGGGAGMIMRIDVMCNVLSKTSNFQKIKHKTILTSPKGKRFNQEKAIEFSKLNNLIIIAGHYEGIDERIMEFVDEEISLGDFVMTGGEIAASAITDSVVRLLPGVLKKAEATQSESFFSTSIKRLIEVVGETAQLKKLIKKGVDSVKLLEYPQYTRPVIFNNRKVPEILLSGNHGEIEKWRLKKAYEKTVKKRKDLFDSSCK